MNEGPYRKEPMLIIFENLTLDILPFSGPNGPKSTPKAPIKIIFDNHRKKWSKIAIKVSTLGEK